MRKFLAFSGCFRYIQDTPYPRRDRHDIGRKDSDRPEAGRADPRTACPEALRHPRRRGQVGKQWRHAGCAESESTGAPVQYPHGRSAQRRPCNQPLRLPGGSSDGCPRCSCGQPLPESLLGAPGGSAPRSGESRSVLQRPDLRPAEDYLGTETRRRIQKTLLRSGNGRRAVFHRHRRRKHHHHPMPHRIRKSNEFQIDGRTYLL